MSPGSPARRRQRSRRTAHERVSDPARGCAVRYRARAIPRVSVVRLPLYAAGLLVASVLGWIASSSYRVHQQSVASQDALIIELVDTHVRLLMGDRLSENAQASRQYHGYAMLHWVADGLSYWAVSDAALAELEAFRQAYESAR